MSSAIRVVLAVLIVVGLFLLFAPAFDGYHVGYNSATDHECLSRVVQWCRTGDPAPAPTPTPAPADGTYTDLDGIVCPRSDVTPQGYCPGE